MRRTYNERSFRKPFRESTGTIHRAPRRRPLREFYHDFDFQSLVLVDVPITDFKINSIDEKGAEWSCKVSKGFVDFWQMEDDYYEVNTADYIDVEQGPFVDFTDKSYREVLGGRIAGYLDRDSFQWHLSYDDESFDEEKPFNEDTITEYLINYFASSESSRADGTALVNMWHNTKCYATIASNDYAGKPYDYRDGHIIMTKGHDDYDGYDPRYRHSSWDDRHTLGIYIMEADINAPAIVECIEWVLDNRYGWEYNDWGDDEFEESLIRPRRHMREGLFNHYLKEDDIREEKERILDSLDWLGTKKDRDGGYIINDTLWGNHVGSFYTYSNYMILKEFCKGRKVTSLKAVDRGDSYFFKIYFNRFSSREELDLLMELLCPLHDIAVIDGGSKSMELFKDAVEEQVAEQYPEYKGDDFEDLVNYLCSNKSLFTYVDSHYKGISFEIPQDFIDDYERAVALGF